MDTGAKIGCVTVFINDETVAVFDVWAPAAAWCCANARRTCGGRPILRIRWYSRRRCHTNGRFLRLISANRIATLRQVRSDKGGGIENATIFAICLFGFSLKPLFFTK